MKTTLASILSFSILSFSILSLAALSGCATDVDSDAPADEPVVAKVDDDSTSLAPQQDTAPAPTSGCTTTKSCDKNYCCTTETCRFSTFITCVPNRTKSGTVAAFAP